MLFQFLGLLCDFLCADFANSSIHIDCFPIKRMFGTLRYEAADKAGEFLEHGVGATGVPLSRFQHMACDNCRVKKVNACLAVPCALKCIL